MENNILYLRFYLHNLIKINKILKLGLERNIKNLLKTVYLIENIGTVFGQVLWELVFKRNNIKISICF